jgi:signal transduction histidine kinase
MYQFKYLIGWVLLLLFPVLLSGQKPTWNYDSIYHQITTSEAGSDLYQSYSLYSIKFQLNNRDSALFYLNKAAPVTEGQNIVAIAYYFHARSINLWQQKKVDSSLYFSRKAYQNSKKGSFIRGLALSSGQIGMLFKVLNQTDSAIIYLNQTIDLGDRNGLPLITNKAHYDIAGVYNQIGKQQIALEHQLTALRFQEKEKDTFRILYSYIGLGNTYQSLKKYEKARTFYFHALRFDSLVSSVDLRSLILTNMGLNYEKGFHKLDSALYYYRLSNELLPLNENSQSKSILMINMGNSYFALKQFEKALEYYDKALQYDLEKANPYLYSALLINRGIVLANLNFVDSAINHIHEGLKIAISIDAKEWQLNANQALFDIEFSKKNYASAITYLQKMNSINDSIQKENNLNRISELEIIYESRKKDALNQSLIERNNLDQKIIRNQRIIIIWSVIAVILFILLVFNILRSIRKQKIINEKLQHINFEILKKNAEIDEKNHLLEEKTEQLTKINQTKDKLFSVISHDLRGPFNILQGYLDLMNMQDASMTEEEKTEILKSIKISSENAHNLLVNLLEWARSQRGLLKNKAEVIDMHDVIENVHNIMQNRLDSKNQSLVVDVDPGIYVIADHNLLLSVFQNLIGNAIKFSSHDSTIAIRCSTGHTHLTIQILDQGIGIPKENLAEIFIIGNNIKRKGTDNEPGTGLGLVLVEEFIKLMGGQIRVESEVGKGSVFSFTLPLFRSKK